MESNAAEAHEAIHRELIKKDEKFLFVIHQCMDTNIFKKIIKEEMTKSAWDTLKMLYEGDEKLKKVMQSLRKKYENRQVNDGEVVSYSSKGLCC